MSYVESRNLSSLGTNLSTTVPKTSWFLGSSMGRELKLISFLIDSTIAGLNLDWRLLHPAVNGSGDKILLMGRMEDMTAGVPVVQVTNQGTLGYHEPLVLRFTEQSDGTFSTNAKLVSELLVTLEYEASVDMEYGGSWHSGLSGDLSIAAGPGRDEPQLVFDMSNDIREPFTGKFIGGTD